VAVLLVFSVHYLGSLTGFAGWTGVPIFFVLSGFLITGLLYDNQHELFAIETYTFDVHSGSFPSSTCRGYSSWLRAAFSMPVSVRSDISGWFNSATGTKSVRTRRA
jgi:hypothetical protein